MVKAADLFCPKCPTEISYSGEMCSRGDYTETLQKFAAGGGALAGFAFNFLPQGVRQTLLGLPIGFIVGLVSQNTYPDNGAPMPATLRQNHARRFLNYVVEDQGIPLNLVRGGTFALGGGFGTSLIVNKTIESKIFCPKKPSCDIDFTGRVYNTLTSYLREVGSVGGACGFISAVVPFLIDADRRQGIRDGAMLLIVSPVIGGLLGGAVETIRSLSTIYNCE